MRRVLLPFALVVLTANTSVAGPITYFLRDAHFFGGTPGPTREITDNGAFTAATAESLPYTFSTGGPTPDTFTANASNQGTPLELHVVNSVSAQSTTGLTFNIPPPDPTTIVSLVQSGLTETGVVVTGASGVGYLIPTFAIDGVFADTHPTAFGQLSACAGIASCALTGLGNSAGGVQLLSTTFSPTVSAATAFTFGVPFNFFFFVGAGVNSSTSGTLAPGSVSGDFRLHLLGFSVVDGTGHTIDGATVHSDLAPVPEPALGLLVVVGLLGRAMRARLRE